MTTARIAIKIAAKPPPASLNPHFFPLDLYLSYHTLPNALPFAMIRIEVMIVNNKNGIFKMILLALLGTFLAKGLHARQEAYTPTKKEAEGWQALAPIKKAFWLLHPMRAFHFFLLQQSLALTWKIGKKYLK